ncbi:MAG: ribokinase [Pontimonas sp.]
MSSVPIVVFGNCNIDLTSYVKSMPSDGETVLGTDFTIGMGGKGSNQAVAAARAGGTVAFVGAIGNDDFGDMAWSHLSSDGLALDCLTRHDLPTGVANITVDERGRNRIVVALGASQRLTPTAVTDALDHFDGVEMVVSQLEVGLDVVEAGLVEAKKRGITTVLNTAPFSPLSPAILDATDWLIANEVEAAALVGADSAALDSRSVRDSIATWAESLGVSLIVTLGGEGAIGCVAGEVSHSAAPVVTAVDTVGAGDCFVGYFCSFLQEGMSWQQAMRGAVHAASLSVQKAGAQNSYPPAEMASSIREVATA